MVPFPRGLCRAMLPFHFSPSLSRSTSLSLHSISVALCFPFNSFFLCRAQLPFHFSLSLSCSALLSLVPVIFLHFSYFLTPFLRVRLRVFVHVCCLIRGGVKMTRVYVRVCICVDSKAGRSC
ncbi:hypothetical protein F5H01DRAFT_344233 [Linnemannia elongata]|nr:hypothetical protein F5H01DRAFT_344233 [Linnemannia elongata]